MVELRSAVDGSVVPGYERSRCVMLNVNGLRLPLRWDGADIELHSDAATPAALPTVRSSEQPAEGSEVFLRIFFRDATIFAFGVS